jgi:phosphatidylethanolamine/phosphatidyl-N-methylethanolamine N-methyltransferase
MDGKNSAKKLSRLLEKKVIDPLQEAVVFLRQYLAKPDVIGALSPSSSFVAKAIIDPIKRSSQKEKRILEIGAGTGVITKYILEVLQPGDHLDVIEFVPELVVKLRELIEHSDKKNQVIIHEKMIQDFDAEAKYDHVISGLPLTSFPEELVQHFYQKLDREFLNDHGLFSYYEYLWIPQIRLGYHHLFRRTQLKKYEQFRAVLETKKSYLKNKPVNFRKIWLNFTPMRVVHVAKEV